jgi:hypothetical protein
LAHGAEQEAMGRVLEALILATFISQYAESFYNIDYDLPSGWDEARLDQELWRVMMDQVRELDRVLAGLEEGAQLPEALHGEDVLFFLPGNMRTVLEGSRSGNFVQPEDEVIIRRVLGRWEIFLPDESR